MTPCRRPARCGPLGVVGPLLLLALLVSPGAAFGLRLSGTAGAGWAAGAPSAGVAGGTFSTIFYETGLPDGTPWAVTLNGSDHVAYAPMSIVVTLPNGTYPYQIRDVAGWHQTTLPYAGTVTVAGATRSMPTLLFLPETYAVTFVPSGLGVVPWTVTFDGQSSSEEAPNPIVFSVANGTYAYRIADVPGWSLAPGVNASGRIAVAGSGLQFPVPFQRTMYTVRFVEAGLPNGTRWSITVATTLSAAAPHSIELEAPNGSFTYRVGAIPGFLVAPSAGLAVVDGSPLTLSIVFSRIYAVVFVPRGLPAGTPWGVLVNRSVGYTAPSPESIVVDLEPGSYPYRIDPIPGYWTTWSGSFDLANGTLTISVPFSALRYEVAFVESGLPGGTNWSVSLADRANASRAPAPVVFEEQNGTLLFSVAAPPGYSAAPSSGSLAVNGTPGIVRIQFVPNGAFLFGQATGATFATVALAAVVPAAGIGTYVIVRRRRGGGPPPPPRPAAREGATREDPPPRVPA